MWTRTIRVYRGAANCLHQPKAAQNHLFINPSFPLPYAAFSTHCRVRQTALKRLAAVRFRPWPPQNKALSSSQEFGFGIPRFGRDDLPIQFPFPKHLERLPLRVVIHARQMEQRGVRPRGGAGFGSARRDGSKAFVANFASGFDNGAGEIHAAA